MHILKYEHIHVCIIIRYDDDNDNSIDSNDNNFTMAAVSVLSPYLYNS